MNMFFKLPKEGSKTEDMKAMNYDFYSTTIILIIYSTYFTRLPSAAFIGNSGTASSSSTRQLSGKQAIPYASIHEWSCLSDACGLFDPSCVLLRSLSITSAPS